MIRLTDGVISINPMAPDDASAHLAGEDEAAVRFLSGGRSTMESVLSWIECCRESWERSGPVRCFGIYPEPDGGIAGMVEANLNLPSIRPGVANVSYGLYPDHRGRGYAVRAVKLVADYLRSLGDVDRFMIQASTENGPSFRVAEKAGFHYVRKCVSRDGDLLMMYVLNLN